MQTPVPDAHGKSHTKAALIVGPSSAPQCLFPDRWTLNSCVDRKLVKQPLPALRLNENDNGPQDRHTTSLPADKAIHEIACLSERCVRPFLTSLRLFDPASAAASVARKERGGYCGNS